MPETDLVCRLLLEKKKTSKDGVAIEETGESRSNDPFAALYSYHLHAMYDDIYLNFFLLRRTNQLLLLFLFFFFNDTSTTEIYTLSLHDALPICLNELNRGQSGLETYGLFSNLTHDFLPISG